jgi:hypothetical protein
LGASFVLGSAGLSVVLSAQEQEADQERANGADGSEDVS